MYSYSYNHQGPSISRLDELLTRNELIYQNLKQKLDDINKSDLNIKRNISHIHTNYPPHIASYAQSSIIQQENILKSPYAQGRRNLSSINQSNELTFSEGLLQDEFAFSQEKQQRYNETIKQSTRQRELQLISQRKKLEEQLRMSEVSRSKRNQSEVEQSQRSRKSTISNRKQAVHQSQSERFQMEPSTYFPPNATSKYNKSHKGNQIYLLKIPKTSDVSVSEDRKPIENIATFSEFNQDEVQQKQEIKQTIKTKQEDEITFMQDHTQKQNRPKYNLQLSPYSKQQQNRHSYQIESEEYRQTLQKIDTIRQNIRKEKQSSPQDSDFKFTAVSPKQANLYNELNSNIQKKLSAIVNAPSCYLFMPFNKVYRSPILQLKTGGQVLLQRKSKTAPINKQHRITDPIKYKFKSVITDEQTILKLLFAGNDKFDLGLRQNNRVAILGKKDTLKKKLHMGLLAYILESSKYMIANMKANAVLRIEHQEVASQDKSKTVEAEIDVRVGCERVAIMELERTILDVYQAIKGGGNEQKVLRMTKISMKGQNEWSYSIICSNRVDSEFVHCLGASRICWSANPLLKNYEDIRLTLDSMRHFVSSNYV